MALIPFVTPHHHHTLQFLFVSAISVKKSLMSLSVFCRQKVLFMYFCLYVSGVSTLFDDISYLSKSLWDRTSGTAEHTDVKIQALVQTIEDKDKHQFRR